MSNRRPMFASFNLSELFRQLSAWRDSKSARFLVFYAFLALFVDHFSAITCCAFASPRIQFATPAFDFGQVKCGEAVNHTFIFTNMGDQEVEIFDVRPSCGCTSAGPWDRKVSPGSTGSIPVQFNSADFSGPVGKTVIVVSNDPEQTNIVLQLKGSVWKPIDVVPALAWFSTSTDSETNVTQQLEIISNLQEPIAFSSPECTNQSFHAALRTVRPGKEFQLTVTFVRPRAPTTTTAAITLKTTSTNVPLLTVVASAVVQAAVLASPAQLMLSSGPLASGVQLNANILNNGTASLILSDPSIDPPVAVVQVQELKPGRQFLLTANFPAGFKPLPGKTAEIRIKTNHPQYPVVEIPVVGGHTLAADLREADASPTQQP